MENYKLESTEWSRVWRENAPDSGRARVLLIGDSISVGYAGLINKKLDGALLTTTYSTSKALDNPYLLREILLTAEQEGAPYAMIHFNNGLHGWHLDEKNYARLYEDTVLAMREHAPSTRIALALTTPMTEPDNTAIPHAEKNPRVIARNDAARAVAAKYGFAVDDLYTPLFGEASIRTKDGYHYLDEGYDKIAGLVADFLKKELC